MSRINPYRPGAGLKPMYIAGRDEDIQNVDKMFDALKMNIPVQSIIFSGLRGVGKTVLINKLQEIAEDKDIFCKHIEIEERNDFISQIATCSQAFLRQVSTKEKVKDFVQKALETIKSLVVSFTPDAGTFSFSMQDRELYVSNNLTQSLTDVFTTIGDMAYKTGIPICFFVDEIQYMKQEQLGALIAAIHRTNQLGYPVMIIGAGLPKIYKMLSDEKSYSERLFMYKQIDSLTYEQTRKAATEPAKTFNVSYTDSAIAKIAEITKGYPFFIQQLCKIVYDGTDKVVIDECDVVCKMDDFLKSLDEGFFRSRYERCSESDKKFVFAMVRCGDLPCTISNVAKNLGKA